MTVQPPRQIEFARLNIERTVMSKRHLRRLVESGYGFRTGTILACPPWPPCAAGAIPPTPFKDFLGRVGVAKADSMVEGGLLEACVREDMGDRCPRTMAVLNPLKVTFENWPADKVDELEVEYHPDHPEMGTRKLHFTRTCYIEREDFMEEPVKKFFRLAPGKEVRLKGAYIVKCEILCEG